MTARAREIPAHRRWMIRNYSLTFAAVTLRLYLPLAFLLGIPFELSYPLVAWLCWVPNLVAAEYLVSRLRFESTRTSGLTAPSKSLDCLS